MKKILKWAVLVIVLLLIVGGVALYFSLNSIIRSTVQTQSQKSLNVNTALAGANLSLLGQSLSLHDFSMGSPQGFAAPQMMSLGEASVQVSVGHLREEPIHIKDITLKKPMLVIEHVGGKLNFKALSDQMPKTPPAEGEQKPMKLVIDTLTIEDPKVELRPGIPGLDASIPIPLPSITMKNVGSGEGAQNGAAIQEVLMQVVTALAAKAKDSDKVPEQLRQLLNLDVNAVAAQLGQEANKQIEKLTGELGKKLPPDAAKGVEDILKSKGGEDPGKAVEQGIQNLLQPKEKKPTTQPK